MTLSPGFSRAEIRELVHQYGQLRYGFKGQWLAVRGLSHGQMHRWQSAVYDGDLDRGLVPREGSGMTIPPAKRSAFERSLASEREAHASELARLKARNEELEAVNAALGKAIGRLHAISGEAPDSVPTRSDPSSSSSPKTISSPS